MQQYDFSPEAGCEARSGAALEGTATASTSVATTFAVVAVKSYATATGSYAARGPRGSRLGRAAIRHGATCST